jgi:hypothetical protein
VENKKKEIETAETVWRTKLYLLKLQFAYMFYFYIQ